MLKALKRIVWCRKTLTKKISAPRSLEEILIKAREMQWRLKGII